MKLRTKLIIAFVVVMIFPVTFALIAMHAFVPGRGAEIQQLDLHADQIQGFFDVPVDHLYASGVILPYLQSLRLKDAISKRVILTLRSRQNQMTRLDNSVRTLKKCVSD